MAVHAYPCAEPCTDGSVILDDAAAFVPVMCAECYLDYLFAHENEASRLAEPIIFNKVLYMIDRRDSAEGVGPEVIVRRFDDPGQLRTTRLRVVMHLPLHTPDTAVIVHAG